MRLKASYPGILVTGARSPVGPPVYEAINVDEIEDRVDADGMQRLQSTQNWTNLNSFFRRGGKILFYHGVSDHWFSAFDTIDYYERMRLLRAHATTTSAWRLVRVGSGRCAQTPVPTENYVRQ